MTEIVDEVMVTGNNAMKTAKVLSARRENGKLMVHFICKGVYKDDISGELKHCKAITVSVCGVCVTCVKCSARVGGGKARRITPIIMRDESPGWRRLKCNCEEFFECKVPPPVPLKCIVCQKCGVIRKGVAGKGKIYNCPKDKGKCGGKQHRKWALSLVGPSGKE